MATLVARNPRLFQAATTPKVVQRYAAKSTAWGAGQFLRINTSGELVAVSNGATTGGISYQAITDRASGDAAGLVWVIKISPDMIFEMNLTSGTATTALIGQKKGVDVSGTTITVDPSASEEAVTIQNLGYIVNPAVYDSSDTLAVVYVKIQTDIIDADPAA